MAKTPMVEDIFDRVAAMREHLSRANQIAHEMRSGSELATVHQLATRYAQPLAEELEAALHEVGDALVGIERRLRRLESATASASSVHAPTPPTPA